MTGRYTRQAQRVLRRAQAEARRLGLDDFGADSLLLGVLGERGCLAAGVLTRHGLDLQQARRELETRAVDAVYRRSRLAPDSLLPTAWVKYRDELKSRGQVCANTAHLLLGILGDEKSAAVELLRAHGLAVEAVRAALEEAAQRDPAAEGGETATAEKKAGDWLRDLRDPCAEVRQMAGLQLPFALAVERADLAVTAGETVPVLIDLLHAPDELVRATAAGALGHFGPAARAAAPALRDGLADCVQVRAAAAEALAQIEAKDADLAESLARGLDDPSPRVRVAAAKALWTATQEAGRVLPILLAGLTDADAQVRRQAAMALAKLEAAAQNAVPALIAALQDPDEQVRLHTVNALWRIGAPARVVVPGLLALLRDPSPLVNAPAGAALTILAQHAAESLPNFLAALADPDPRLRGCAASALGRLRPAGAPAIAALRQALGDCVALVRYSAAESLWHLEQRQGLVPVLVELLTGSDKQAAAQAASLLALAGTAAVEAIGPLQDALKSDSVQVRIAAATALIRLDQPADALLPILSEGLVNADLGIQLMSASNLGELGPKAMAAVTVLLQAYQGPGNVLRKYAKQALQKIAPEICLEADEPIFAPAEPGHTGCVIIQDSHPTSTERLKDWSEAIRLDPDDIQAFRCRAKLYEQVKEWPNAELDWTEVIRLAPDDALAHIHRGQALRELGEFDRAAADFTVAIRLSPGNADAYNNRAVVWKRKGDYQRAIADYTEAIRLNPKRAGFYRNRSLAAKALKDYAQAQADLEEVLRLAPEHAAGHNDLACFRATCPDAAYRNGAEAVAHGRRACELSGWSMRLFLNTLAAAYAEAGQFDEAVRWIKKALERPQQLKPAQLEEFTARLRLYEQGQPFRAQ